MLVKNITTSYRSQQIIVVYYFLFTAVYNWRGDTRYGLPLEIGETVQILEECAGTKFDTILSSTGDRCADRTCERMIWPNPFNAKGNGEVTTET